MRCLALLALVAVAVANSCPDGCQCDYNPRAPPGGCRSHVYCACGTAISADDLDCVFFHRTDAKPNKLQLDWLQQIPSGARRVDLFGCGIGSIPPGAFAHLSSCRVLNLEYNALTMIPPNAFSGMTKLKVIWLTGHHLRPDDTPHDEYQRVAPDRNMIEQVDEAAFNANPNLAILLLHHNMIKALPDKVFAVPGASLRVLKLVDNQFEFKLHRGAGALKHLVSVKQLDLEEDSGDVLEDWMEETGHYLDDENGDSVPWLQEVAQLLEDRTEDEDL
eukprot:TRINITY_DN2390_c0_g1_i2.p1 TRINITY_DN2390_c0_g1~~TRINITY_DN2390_c0_g1_i2.p1  ORF type:complete len:275 (-),score=72.09 TRINITY_DN2390_c0_g1_i2:342-1166(-)